MNHILIYSPQAESHLAEIVEDAGFSVFIEQEIVLLAAEAQNTTPIAILVDMVTDEAQGRQALQSLKNYPATAAYPHIAITPPSPEVRLRALENGANELITHPVDPIELRTRLRSMISLSNARHASHTGESEGRITEERLMGMVDVLEHDLRSPVGIAFSSLDLMSEILQEDTQTPAPTFQLLDNTVIAMRRQLFMVEDLIDWIRLEAHQFEGHRGTINLQEEITLGLRHAQALANSNGILIVTDVPAGLPMPIGDAVLFRRVINAVLDTALKFCLKGHEIKITAQQQDNGVLISIADPGRAIKEHYRDNRLFDIDRQSEARNVGSRSSVGMGLPFARAAVEHMGGRITLDTSAESGLTILTIWLAV